MPALTKTHKRAPDRSAPSPRYKKFGSWQTTALLGEGRWTAVYRATPEDRDPRLPADYAVKALRPEFANDSTAIGMLQREAFVATQVSNAYLATVLIPHTDEPPFYLVSPYLEGVTLRAALDYPVRFNLPQILWMTRQISEALATLHEAGWSHGDVKPANTMVSPEGHATLFDLGFAKRLGNQDNKNVLVGTVTYAAPETFHPKLPTDAKSDVYSLGVVLFEMLTGRCPFPSKDPSEVAIAHLHESAPDVRSLAPDVPNRVSNLVRRLLAKDPLRRPDSDELIYRLATLEVEYFDQRAALV